MASGIILGMAAAMAGVWIVLGVVALVLAVGGIARARKAARRREVRARELSASERDLLNKHVPLFRMLPQEHHRKLEGCISVFLDEISFEACGGLPEVTDEMRLGIAVQACLLLVGSGYADFGRLRSVLIYPNAYQTGEEEGSDDVRLGESWQTGSVVLSWQSVVEGARNPEDGRNVVIHEFAHQIDQYDGDADGLPLLKAKGDYRKWAQAFSKSYDLLCERVNAGKRTVLDPYGATNPAEFFAVATETFFEKPVQLQRKHPAVYEELRTFYGLDPMHWER